MARLVGRYTSTVEELLDETTVEASAVKATVIPLFQEITVEDRSNNISVNVDDVDSNLNSNSNAVVVEKNYAETTLVSTGLDIQTEVNDLSYIIAAGVQGPRGAQGAMGLPGTPGANGGVYQEFVNTTSVNVAHNFHNKPVINVLDDHNRVIIPESIIHNSDNDVTITFSRPKSGTIIATFGGQSLASYDVLDGGNVYIDPLEIIETIDYGDTD